MPAAIQIATCIKDSLLTILEYRNLAIFFVAEVIACRLNDIVEILLVVTREFRVDRHAIFAVDEVAVLVHLLHIAVHETNEEVLTKLSVGFCRFLGDSSTVSIDCSHECRVVCHQEVL